MKTAFLPRVDFAWSDTHFGHAKILVYSSRPFPTIEAHDAELVRLHNAVVRDDSVVLHVGDFALCGFARASEIASQLCGRRVLVRGNHDRFTATQYLRMGFEEVCDEAVFDSPSGLCRFVARHHPTGWHERVPDVTVHGHTHSRSRGGRYRVHAGVDANEYMPVSAAALEAVHNGMLPG